MFLIADEARREAGIQDRSRLGVRATRYACSVKESFIETGMGASLVHVTDTSLSEPRKMACLLMHECLKNRHDPGVDRALPAAGFPCEDGPEARPNRVTSR